MRGTPSASVERARGPRDASGYAVHGRVTPRHNDHGPVIASIFIGN